MAAYSVDHFENYCQEYFIDRTALLDEFFETMKWHPSEVVLDVGSGPGTTTRELLWPRLKAKNVVNLIGMDSYEDMVKYAQEKHSVEGISFVHGNIEHNDSIPREFEQKFSKVFSFFALQDVSTSMRQALNNLNWSLQPNGEICLLMVATSPLTNPQIQVWNLSPFIEFSSKAQFNICCGNEIFASPNVEPGFEVLLRQCGFEVSTIQVEDAIKKYKNAESYMELVSAMDSNYGRLTDNLKPLYKEELYKRLIKSPQSTCNDGQMVAVLGKDGTYLHHEKMLRIHAIKKAHMKMK